MDVVLPSYDDAVAAAGTEALGGRAGRRMRHGHRWWTPLRVMVLLVLVTFSLGIAQKAPCRSNAWDNSTQNYSHACYSDIAILYSARGFADYHTPYVQNYNQQGPNAYLEYPVVIGLTMWGASEVTHALDNGNPYSQPDPSAALASQSQTFFDITVLVLMVASALTVIAVAKSSGRRPWDGLLFALAPCLLLDGTINWDMIAVAFTALGMWAWAARRPGIAGVFLGLGVATKLYPVLVIIVLLFLCIRAARLRAFGAMVVGACVSWLAVNLPFMIANFHGWAYFYQVNESGRGADLGSVWDAINLLFNTNLSTSLLNVLEGVIIVLAVIGIAMLALLAPTRPRFAQLAFLAVMAFALPNKVYSPQYVLWLIPLAVLARPRWRDFLIWQLCEVVYFFSVWGYLLTSGPGHGLSARPYAVAIIIHIVGTLYFGLMVLRDILEPQCDPVRMDGTNSDDPGGGVLDGTPDAIFRHEDTWPSAPPPEASLAGIAAPPHQQDA